MDDVNFLISGHLHFMGVPKKLVILSFLVHVLYGCAKPRDVSVHQEMISNFSILSHVQEQVCMYMYNVQFM